MAVRADAPDDGERSSVSAATPDAFTAQYVAMLAQAGITILTERLPGAVAAAVELQTHIARVNAACPPDAPPAITFSTPA